MEKFMDALSTATLLVVMSVLIWGLQKFEPAKMVLNLFGL